MLNLDFSNELLKLETAELEVCPHKKYKNAAELFADDDFCSYIRMFWPYFTARANDLCLQNGALGQECGKMRERALIYLFYRFIGEDFHACDIDHHSIKANEKGRDVIMFGRSISIKTVSWGRKGKGFNQLKVSWIEDKNMAADIEKNWIPEYDILLARIKWDSSSGGLYYIPKLAQQEVVVLKTSGGYSKGTAVTGDAQEALVNHPDTLKLNISMPIENRDENYLNRLFDDLYVEVNAQQRRLEWQRVQEHPLVLSV